MTKALTSCTVLTRALVLAAMWSAQALAQSRAQPGPLCTSEDMRADKQIDACNKIIALKVFSGDDPPNQRH